MRLAMIAVIMLGVAGGDSLAAATSEEIILIVRRQASSEDETKARAPVVAAHGPVTPAPERSRPQSLDEVYEAFWNHPNQIYIDSPSGPKPLLGMDIVQEGGRIYPRVPDPYTYRIMQDPDDYDAYIEYLDWRKAVIRRTRIAMGRVPEVAYDEGIITPEVLAVPGGYETGSGYVGVHDVEALDEGHLGTPFFNNEQATELGIPDDEVPVFPGEPADLEIYLFWHPRCQHCHTMMRDWFHFGEPLVKAGYKVTGIISARSPDAIDTNEVVGAIEAMVVRYGEPVRAIKNIRDWTGLVQSLRVTGTPTVVFVDRKAQQIIRRVGPQTLDELREAFWSITDVPEGTWPPPKLEGAAEPLPSLPRQTPLSEGG